MFEQLIKMLAGDLNEKRAYRRIMRRANTLPKEYRFAFRKMRNYIFTVGYSGTGAMGDVDLALFDGLVGPAGNERRGAPPGDGVHGRECCRILRRTPTGLRPE